ncbi:MAG: serine/threonine protein kinase [Alphaproteobacteria bacterium]|nr:serine/threonine protein kinase [Alphaproteobacteria bacterium]
MHASSARRYRILEVLGTGGFGTVYRAEMTTSAGLRREVALKVLNERAAADEHAAARLRDEARILSNLNYIGIVRVDDLLQLDGRWTMVMELVDGVDLERLLERSGPMPPSVALELVASVARTLHAATLATDAAGRALELVHRDIKPANILVTTGGITKLLDFGVARAQLDEREAATQEAIVMGSLPFLAPERFGFEDLPAGDVYALGAVFYEALTGERFGRTRLSETGHKQKLREALHTAWEQLPPEGRKPLLEFCALALAFKHQRRPTAAAFAARADELARAAKGPTLAAWAAEHVTHALKSRGHAPADGLCGAVLTEVASQNTLVVTREEIGLVIPPAPVSAEPPTEPPPAARPSTETPTDDPATPPPTHRLGVLFAFGALGLALSLGGMLAWERLRAPPPPPRVAFPELPEGPRLTLDDVVAAAPEPADTEPVASEAPTATPPSAEGPSDDPDEIEVTEEVPADASPWDPVRTQPSHPTRALGPRGHVLVLGEAEHAYLVGASGQVEPGPVSPGVYTVFPSFPGGFTVKGPDISVMDGQTVVVRCVEKTRTCAVDPEGR